LEPVKKFLQAFGAHCQRYWARAKPILRVYLRRYWKQLAGLALAAGAILNAKYDLLPPGVVATIGTIAGALGIAMHKPGDPLPPAPPLPAWDEDDVAPQAP